MPIDSIINLRDFIPVVEKRHAFPKSLESPWPLAVSDRDKQGPDSSFLATGGNIKGIQLGQK